MLFRNPFTIELMPRVVLQEGNAALLRRIPPGTRVFLPHLPASHFDEIIAAAVAVQRAGLRPVPHVAARRWQSAPQAGLALQALSRAVGQDEDGLELLILGGTERSLRGTAEGAGLGEAKSGEPEEPAPAFDDALALIKSDLVSEAGVRTVGVAAHPEGIPGVPRAITDAALRDKSEALRAAGIHASAVTQFCFDARVLHGFIQRLPALGLTRINLGVVGPVKPAALAKYARACGVAIPDGAARSGDEFEYSPSALLAELEELITQASGSPDKGAAVGAAGENGTELSLHVFPFGGLRTTLDWLESQV